MDSRDCRKLPKNKETPQIVGESSLVDVECGFIGYVVNKQLNF